MDSRDGFKVASFLSTREVTAIAFLGGSSPFLVPLLGNLFEDYAYQVLSVGGLFYGRLLDDETRCQPTLPKMEIRDFTIFQNGQRKMYTIEPGV